MPQAPYIPARDADFAVWLANLSTLVTAHPTDYGLIAGDAVIIAGVNTPFQAAYLLATNPATRTGPTIAAKDAARAAATATVRPYCVSISLNDGVSDELKLGVGVNLPNPTRTPIPAPLTNPTLTHVGSISGQATIGSADSETPLSKAKPAGAVTMEVRQQLGTAPAVDPDAAAFVGLVTKSPFQMTFEPSQVGKVVTVWGRWRTKSGPAGISQAGPWSAALTFAVI